ncbi:MAG: GDCCVxC domain-containing (seleno)protein [Saprospiraceae bacterium]|jgi:hypothetical protein|nr:GDCCVxC domain-containing (seleno)protein [Saprospiraceae bacterium]
MQLKANQSLLGGILAFIIATSCCWLPALAIMLGGASGLMAFSQGLEKFSRFFMIIGGGFLIYGGYQFYKKKSSNTPILESTITCPNCGFSKTETMPTNACQFFYECQNCKTLLKPKEGDCCVYCSFGTVKCPPIQLGEDCC